METEEYAHAALANALPALVETEIKTLIVHALAILHGLLMPVDHALFVTSMQEPSSFAMEEEPSPTLKLAVDAVALILGEVLIVEPAKLPTVYMEL